MKKASFSGFEWDEGNRLKCLKHGVSIREIEYVLTHAETLITSDPENSQNEERFLAVGRNPKGRYTFVVFTPRGRDSELRLRPISARYMHDREVKKYEQEIPRTQKR